VTCIPMCASLTRLAAVQTRVQLRRLASQVVQTHTPVLRLPKLIKLRGPQRAIQFHPCWLTLHVSLRRTKRLQLSFVCSSHEEADVSERSTSVDSVEQAGPSRRQERALAFTARPQISLPGENRYSGMAGQGDKFGREAPGSYTPGSAGQGVGRQSTEHEFVHQYCRLCAEEGKDNPYWYTSRSKLSDHATVCHRHWYSSRLDAFSSIADQELQGKWGKVSKRQAHRRLRCDTTFAPGRQSEQGDESLVLPPPGTPQFHSQDGFAPAAAAGVGTKIWDPFRTSLDCSGQTSES